jgi:hypothetical protein
MPTLPIPLKVTAGAKKVVGTDWKGAPKVTAGVKKVGGTDWKGGWHRLERWVAPIGKVGGTDWREEANRGW